MPWLEELKRQHPEWCFVKTDKQRPTRRRFRNEWKSIVIEAMGGCCQCCGYDACQAALEFHHIDPSEKDHNMTHILSEPGYFNEAVKELKKCVMVCANCHREIHAGVREVPANVKKVDVEYLKEQLRKVAPIASKRLKI